MDIDAQKDILRKSVYDAIYNDGFSNRPNGDYGKIPDFKGSVIAAELLRTTFQWKTAQTIFSSPDTAQKPVRYFPLEDGKDLIMASPNLQHGYLFLKSSKITSFVEASTKDGAFKFSEDLNIEDYPKVDMVVEGSVAVDKKGNRIGKGKGFGDREIQDLLNRKLIDNNTPIVTTIHPLQLVDSVINDQHDKVLNMIVTTDKIIRI
ncbi:5-formyltetrahydrofolate cyclo-ligase [uncultured Methanobrevibacter sp.]|uniref:5-formyltetrahydrofolate cyclo-ligase n=1 Tax=uncultured Methanobrevibacter sp. TaxID=253161 RepID=UPI0025DD9A8B|nr:5-formyltetrahydrofolate cyclo-ligase [uncultured Methanobrevibacter sp.]